MEIYLDMVVLLNFLVDYLLLLGTNRLSGFPPGSWRCAAGALLGGLYAGACLLPGFRFLGSILWRTVMLCLMAMLAFGINTSALKRGGIFLLLSLAMGGMAISAGRGDFLSLLLSGGGIWLLCSWAFGGAVGGREYVPVELRWQGNTLSLIALRDTGNTLRDPITGEQVLVIGAQAAQDLTGLTLAQIASPLETLTQHPLPGLRLIPYHAVGKMGGMLLAMRFSDVRIGNRRQSALVAFAPEGLGRGDAYQALTGSLA